VIAEGTAVGSLGAGGQVHAFSMVRWAYQAHHARKAVLSPGFAFTIPALCGLELGVGVRVANASSSPGGGRHAAKRAAQSHC